MKIVNMALDQIKPYKNNPRDNTKAVSKVVESIKQFGFNQPLVIGNGGVILVGHTRYLAAKELGLKEVPVLVKKNLTPEQEKAYRIADNKTADYSIWDNKKLLEELDSIDENIFTGFDASDIFDDILDPSDTLPLDETEQGIVYTINFKTQDKDLYEKVKEFIDDKQSSNNEEQENSNC